MKNLIYFAQLPTGGCASQLVVVLEKENERKALAFCPGGGFYFGVEVDKAMKHMENEPLEVKEESSFENLFKEIKFDKLDEELVENFLKANLSEELKLA
ncbi:MAG: hypothetical protein KC516_02020 [Nanoarchaeota archaeon]|nr:hypothetical protein [Nanoarchaeota archaeon]